MENYSTKGLSENITDVLPVKQFSSVLVSSVIPGASLHGNLTGIPRRIKDSCADFYNYVQKWNSYAITGVNILKELVIEKLRIINLSEEKTGDDSSTGYSFHLQELCDQLHALIIKMEKQVSKMGKIADELRALSELQKLQSPASNCEGDDRSHQQHVFQTWPTIRFYDAASELTYIYERELEAKQCIAQEIAHLNDENALNFFVAVWTYQPYIEDQSQLLLQSMVVETGLQ